MVQLDLQVHVALQALQVRLEALDQLALLEDQDVWDQVDPQEVQGDLELQVFLDP